MTLRVLTSDALVPVRHGFFTRKGGASSGVFAGLNCGAGSSDQSEAVATNRARVSEHMGGPLVSLHQTHSNKVVTVDAPHSGSAPEADGIVTATSGLVLGILTADCQPVLFADSTAGVVGAAHAGWKGAMDGVLEATVDAMESLGAERTKITAIIGPSISQCAYEVGPEFLVRFLDDDPDNQRFFAGGKKDRVQFDLISYGLHRLREAGIGRAEWTGHCTYADPEHFFSYRRTTHTGDADYGRLMSAIRL